MIGEAAFGEAVFAGEDTNLEVTNWVEMEGAIGDSMAFGPDYITDTNGDVIEQPGTFVLPMTVEIVDPENRGTVLTTLPYVFDRSFDDVLNDTGTGQFALANTDTAALAIVDTDMMVNYKVYGTKAFSILIESKNRVTLTEGEEHDQITAMTGRGHLSMLENAVLYPSRGVDVSPIEEDRTFNWSSPSTVYDDSGWGRASSITDVATAQVIWPHLPFVEDWPDPTTDVIWASSGSYLYAPGGTCYFRKDVTIPTDGWYLLYAAADNRGEMYLDGQKVLDMGTFTQPFEYSVYITSGQHTLAFKVDNYHASGPFVQGGVGQGPAGLVFALFTETSEGLPGTLIANSDSTWKIVAYPPKPPGMYVGEVLHVVFDEAIARGVYLFDQINLKFNTRLDSAGRQWPETLDIASKVGTSYLVFLIEQAVSYIDFWMKPGTFDLYAWNKGTKQRISGISLHAPTDENDPTSGNLFEQAHTVLG